MSHTGSHPHIRNLILSVCFGF